MKFASAANLRDRQEGKAVFVTRLGHLRIQDIFSYMTKFGKVVNISPSENHNNPHLLHSAIVEFETEEEVVKILSHKKKHRVELSPPKAKSVQYQDILVFEKKRRERSVS